MPGASSTPVKKGRGAGGTTKPGTPTKKGGTAPGNKENGEQAMSPSPRPPSAKTKATHLHHQGTRSQAGPKLWQHPYVNVFKLCGLDQMHNATREGDVSTVVDRGIGRKAILINGNVPAANFLRLPKVGGAALGLTGRYLYAQVKLDPERFYTIHVDCLCSDPYGASPSKPLPGPSPAYQGQPSGTLPAGGKQTVRLSLSNLYKSKKADRYAHLAGSAVNLVYEPPARGWAVLVFDIPELLQQSGINERFESVKAVQLGAAMAARNIFTSDTLYAPEQMPKEMALSTRAETVFDVILVGNKPPPAVPVGASPPPNPGRFQSAFNTGGSANAGLALAEGRQLGFTQSMGVVEGDMDDVGGNGALGGSAIDDMIASGMTLQPSVGNRPSSGRPSRPRTAPPSRPMSATAVALAKAEGTRFGDSSTNRRTLIPSNAAGTNQSASTSASPPNSRAASASASAKRLTKAAAGKPRTPVHGRATAHGADTGFFGAGGAGGLVNHRTQVFQGRPEEVHATTGMPLPLASKPPTSVPAGAAVDPVLGLERVIGLSGQHSGAVVWAPGGRTVAYPCNNMVIVADVETGVQSHLFGHTEDVHLLCFSKDGRVLASGQKGRHPTIRVWECASQQCIATLYAHASALRSLDISPDGRALAAAGMDTQGRQLIAVWDISQSYVGGPSPSVLRHRTDYHVNCIRFSPFEEDHLVTCGKNSIRTYRLKKGQLRGCSVNLGDLKLSKMVTHAPPGTQDFQLNDFTTLAFEIGYGITELDSKHVYVATVTGAVVQVNYGKRCLECVYQLHDGAINALCINEGFAVTASDDRFLRVWPVDFSDFFLEAEHEAAVTSASVSSDGLQIVAATATGSLGTLDIPSHAYRTLLRSHNAAVYGVAADPQNDEAATVSEDGTIRVWDITTGEQLYEFDAPGESARCAAYRPRAADARGGPGGQRALACGFTNGLSRVFDVGATALLAEHRQHKGAVVAVAFTPDGGRMITAGSEGNLCVYDANQGYLPIKYLATALPTNRVGLAVSSDGALLATIGPNAASVLLFDMDSLQLRPPALRPPGGAIKIAFAPDSNSLLVAGDTTTVARYDVTCRAGDDGTPTAVVPNTHTGECSALAVDPSQRLIVTGGKDGMLKAWPLGGLRDPALPPALDDEVPVQSFVGHASPVLEVVFASKGRRLVSVGAGDAVFVWGVDDVATRALADAVLHDHVTFSEGEENILTLDNDNDDDDDQDGGAFPDDNHVRHTDADGADSDGSGSNEGDESKYSNSGGRKNRTTAFAPSHTLANTPAKGGGGGSKSPSKSVLKSPGKYATSTAAKKPLVMKSPKKSRPRLVQRNLQTSTAEGNCKHDRFRADATKNVPLHAWAAPVPAGLGSLLAPMLPPFDDDEAAVASAMCTEVSAIRSVSVEPTQLRPVRVLGLSSGTAAAAEEETENAAAVAAAAAAPPAAFVPELGAVVFAAGIDVVVERVGGDRQQALLRRHVFSITALAHHSETKRIASASAAAGGAPGECVVYVWDATTGACLRELRHTDCCSVVTVAFSPEGALLLSVGADPSGAVRVWDVASGVAVAAAAAAAPVASAAWCVHASIPEFATAGADGVTLWRVTGGAAAEMRPGRPATAGVSYSKVPFDTLGAAAMDGYDPDPGSPVCTACAVAASGALFVGDSHGRLWRAALTGRPAHYANDPALPLSLCCQALPRGEAITAVAAVAGGRVFIGSARRARVWVNDARGAGWEEVGELELDGAVVTAAFTDDALTGVIGAPKPSGIVTTSAGSAWLVEVTTGTARALVQSHPLNVTYVAVARVGRRDALATVSQDGTARVWDAASSAKVIEVHADPRATTRAHAVAVSPDGSHICLGCNDGSVGVVSVSSGGGGVSGSPGVQGPVKHVPAHPGGGPVMCLAFLPPPLLAPRGWGLTPLLSVASDGSIALTATHANEHDGADFPTEIVAAVAVTTAPHHSDPVAAAAVEGETNPALVAIARAGVLHVYAVDSVEHKAALRATYAPNASRFAALSPAGVAPAKPALVAWSASQPGVVVYCSQATAGKIVIFNVASSAVTRVLDTVLGAGLGEARCLSVVYRPGGGDVIAVGGGDGVEFVELPDASSAEEQGQGYLMHSSSFGGIPLEDGRQLSTSQPISSHGGGGLRRGMMSLPGGVDSMAWAEDGKSAWVASGNCVYVVTNPATHLR